MGSFMLSKVLGTGGTRKKKMLVEHLLGELLEVEKVVFQ
jgi:hypothetical protein